MRWLISSLFLFGLSLSAQAQTLNMPEPTADDTSAGTVEQMPVQSGQKTHVQSPSQSGPQTGVPGSYEVNVPGRGMSMDEVEKRFGTPNQKLDEVGQPPITRWIYNDFTVYFEYQYVIHSVVTKAAP